MLATSPLRVLLANPRGFCAGVVRAIDIVERMLAEGDGPVFVRHQIVHNRHVVERLARKGAVFVDEVEEIPPGARTVFSAHGVAPSVEAAARARGLDVVDATCPLVRRVHIEGRRYAERGYDVILIGHEGHAEVEGARGQIGGRLHVVGTAAEIAAVAVADETRVAYVTQTTLSLFDTREIVDALKRRFPHAVGPELTDICYATHNRQAAVMDLAGKVEALIVVGSPNSSNANRLRELGESFGVPSRLVDDPSDLDTAWLDGVATLGLTAGASTPEDLVDATLRRLEAARPVTLERLAGVTETMQFKLPAKFSQPAARL